VKKFSLIHMDLFSTREVSGRVI